jgi:hypothetical protein
MESKYNADEIAYNWSTERIREMYRILDEALLIKKQNEEKLAANKEHENLRRVPRYDIPVQGAGPSLMQAQALDADAIKVDPSQLRYDLVPRVMLDRVAERFTFGLQFHGERSYQNGLGDRRYILARINHIQEHWNKLLHPDYSKADSPEHEEGIDIKSIRDNLGAILFGLSVLCEAAEHKEGRDILMDIRAEGRVKTYSD